MKRSELKQIIREEAEKMRMNEGILTAIFGKIGEKKAKQVEKKLAKDPDYQQIQKNIEKIKSDMDKIKSKYKNDEFFKDLM